MLRKPLARSRSGCFTCRRRKKKCDESSYPSCKNCTSNRLQCSWPDHVVSVHEKKQYEYASILRSKPTEELLQISLSPNRLIPNLPVILLSDNRVVKSEKKGKNYILQRISMQQDCVEDLQEDLFDFLDSVTVEPPVAGHYSAAPISLIRERIARQLDIPGEEVKRNVYEENNTQI